jgi:NAD(P)-dependent dehydrogenase (short-subunit alcohol dehydrogenase family)
MSARSNLSPAFRVQVAAALQAKWSRDRFDALVNNAGYGTFNLMETVSKSEFDGLLNVHLKGPFFLTQTLLP